MAVRRDGGTEVLGTDVRTHRGAGAVGKAIRRTGRAARDRANALRPIPRTDARRVGAALLRGTAPDRRSEAGARRRQRPTGESPWPAPDGRRAGGREAPSHLPPRETHDDGDAKSRARPNERPRHRDDPAVPRIHVAADRGACQEERHRKVTPDYAQLRIPRIHSPLNFGSRFSMKAWRPS